MAADMVKSEGVGSVWVPVILGSVLSGAASGVIHWLLASREKPKKSCSCKVASKSGGEQAKGKG